MLCICCGFDRQNSTKTIKGFRVLIVVQKQHLTSVNTNIELFSKMGKLRFLFFPENKNSKKEI